MVATVRCDEIAQQKILELSSHEEWKDLQESANSGPVIGFGNRLRALLDRIISGYDTEAAYFEGSVRDKKRNLLVSRSFEIAQPAYQAVIGHHRAKAFDNFKNNLNLSSKSLDQGFTSFVQSCRKTCLDEFDKGCADAHIPQAGWDSLKARDKLQRDIEACVASVREQKLLEIENVFKRRLEEALALPAASLLDAASSDTWPALRKLFHREIEIAKAGLSAAIAGYELDENSTEKMLSDLSEFGRSVIEKKAREEASKALMRMKDRFMAVFSHDAESMPRVWSKEEDISAITKDARLAALKLLSIVAAIRLDEKSDTVEAALTSLIGDGQEIVQRSAGNFTSSEHRSAITSASNALASSTWEGIAGEDTLLTPVQCRNLWRQFKSETEYTISQALAAQEASRRAVSWLPPPWAILVMIVLGFNEFMALLRNPIYLAVGFVLYLLGKALWVQLDIGREFQHGFLAGALSVSSKLLPTLMTILKRLVEEGQQLGASEDSVTANGRRYNKEIQMHEFDSRASSNESSSANGHDVSGCSYEAETR
ncbi:hypothetical protein O6H91_07G034700 [Diphasiastrum complanatum]|nr:hypothetical protein O6H91_07G034700 [Diphasiastrum complanatum]